MQHVCLNTCPVFSVKIEGIDIARDWNTSRSLFLASGKYPRIEPVGNRSRPWMEPVWTNAGSRLRVDQRGDRIDAGFAGSERRPCGVGNGRKHGLLITHCPVARVSASRKPIYFRWPGTEGCCRLRSTVSFDKHFISGGVETLRWCAACRAPPKNTPLRGPALSPSARTLIGTAIENNFPKHLAPRRSILHVASRHRLLFCLSALCLLSDVFHQRPHLSRRFLFPSSARYGPREIRISPRRTFYYQG